MKITKNRLRQIIKEEIQRLNEIVAFGSTDPNAPEFSPRDPATGLSGWMKPLYRLVMKKRPDLELLDDPVEVFKRAYNYAGQTGMANVYDIIAKMEDLSQEPDPRDVRPPDLSMHDVMGERAAAGGRYNQPLVRAGGRHEKIPGYHYDNVHGVHVRDDYNPRTDYGDELDKAISTLRRGSA